MIQEASKYSTLPAGKARRAAAASQASRPESQQGRDARPNLGSGLPACRPAGLPVLRRPIWKDIDEAAEQMHVLNVADSRRRSGLNLCIPSPKSMSQGDWRWRELREGGCLHAYLNRMRGQTRQRWEAVGRARHGFKQNPKSDFQLLASVPAYDYFRWTRLDRHFFRDPKNLRALKRDNAHVTSVFV